MVILEQRNWECQVVWQFCSLSGLRTFQNILLQHFFLLSELWYDGSHLINNASIQYPFQSIHSMLSRPLKNEVLIFRAALGFSHYCVHLMAIGAILGKIDQCLDLRASALKFSCFCLYDYRERGLYVGDIYLITLQMIEIRE